MPALKIGIVGCGDIAGYSALISRITPEVRFTACCDRDPERAERFAGKHRIEQVFDNLEAMLQKAEIDAVYLAVPHNLHDPMVRLSIAAGKPVLLEKPLARNYQEGKELISAIEQAGIKVGVNYQYRYDTGCYGLVRAVQSGALGEIHAVRINVPWSRETNYFSQSGWHASKEQAGGGTLITQGSHFLDIALWAMGVKVRSVMGYCAQRKFRDVEVEDLAQAVIEMKNGTLVQITSTMAAVKEEAVSIEFYGEKGSGIYRNRPLPHVRFKGVRVIKARPPISGLHALQRSLTGFARWIMHDQPYLIPAEESLEVLRIVDMIYRSAESGSKVVL